MSSKVRELVEGMNGLFPAYLVPFAQKGVESGSDQNTYIIIFRVVYDFFIICTDACRILPS